LFDGTELKTVGMLVANDVHPLSGKPSQMNFYAAAAHDDAILGITEGMNILSINVKKT
jgi:hypothetical protein